MKSMIRTAKPEPRGKRKPASSARREVAQCCAKVSKTVAGCHD